MNIIISSIIGYLIGSIPFALVIGKVFYKVDVREHGSGNLGGTNAGRTLGAKAGVSVAVLDILKAFIAMLVVSLFSKDTMIFAGFFATIGHSFPVFANFKGGKSVSTAAGFLVGIALMLTHNPFHVIIPAIIFLTVLYLSKMVSLSSMIALLSGSIYLFISKVDLKISGIFLLITLIVIFRHKENIRRIIDGNENKITWM